MDAKKEKAITALLSLPTVTAAAAEVGVTERTIRRWLADDPEFIAEYRQARSAAFQAALSRLQALAGDAVECLERNLKAEAEGVQVRAALGVLELAKGAAADDLAERLATLETLVRELSGPKVKVA